MSRCRPDRSRRRTRIAGSSSLPPKGGIVIEILLSTHNGSKYLPDFVASLARQSCREFRLLAMDDASEDDSATLLSELCRMHHLELTVIITHSGQLGVVKAYHRLIQFATSPYLCFADQDDVWHPEKLAQNLAKMRQNEERYGADTPILIHSDLRVCDQNLGIIHPSFVRYQQLSPERTGLRQLLVQNAVTGCTVMFNRALAQHLKEFPPEAIYHDWYAAVTAAAFGVIDYIAQPLVDYRQHQNNQLGAVRYHWRYGWQMLRSGRAKLHWRLVKTQQQSAGFLTLNHAALTPAQRMTVQHWATIDRQPFFAKRLTALRNGYTKNTLMRAIGLWWAL